MNLTERITQAGADTEVEVTDNDNGTWFVQHVAGSVRQFSRDDLAQGVFESWLEQAREVKPKPMPKPEKATPRRR